MLQLTNKYKLYLYLVFFIFLSSIFNLKILKNFEEKFILKKIEINGLTDNEKKLVKNELDFLININIFKLSKSKILQKLNKFKFLDEVYVYRVMPSSISLNFYKTAIQGKTVKNGETFYIGKNKKLINSSQVFETITTPVVFGDFKINEYLKLQNILKDNQFNLSDIDKYYYYKNKRWDLSFTDGITLMLPSKEISKSIKIFKNLIDNDEFKNIKNVDLRVPNQIILTHYNE